MSGIRSAATIWGLANDDTLARIREEVGEAKACDASIGPDGERLILAFNVMTEYYPIDCEIRVRDLLEQLGIPEYEVNPVLINGFSTNLVSTFHL